MADLFRAEFFKLRKSLGYRVCLIAFLVKDILYLLLGSFISNYFDIGMTGFSQFEYLTSSFSGSTTAGMLFGFLAASLITNDYKSRDMQCAIAQGHGRFGILTVKAVVYTVAIWILSLEDIIMYTAGASVIGGFGESLTGDRLVYMIRTILCEGFVMAMMYTTCIFFAFLITSKAASVAVNILMFFFIDLGVELVPYILIRTGVADDIEKLISYLPFVSVRGMADWGIDWSYAGLSLLIAFVYGAAMLAAAWLCFRKRDLR